MSNEIKLTEYQIKLLSGLNKEVKALEAKINICKARIGEISNVMLDANGFDVNKEHNIEFCFNEKKLKVYEKVDSNSVNDDSGK